MLENEAVFREVNEDVQKKFDEINQMSLEEGTAQITLDDHSPLYFYCECSDEDCHQRIKMTPATYNRIHKDRKSFIVLPNHQASSIEKVTKKKSAYSVVKKHLLPPEHPDGLRKTPISNT
jgi:hypothetical protein